MKACLFLLDPLLNIVRSTPMKKILDLLAALPSGAAIGLAALAAFYVYSIARFLRAAIRARRHYRNL